MHQNVTPRAQILVVLNQGAHLRKNLASLCPIVRTRINLAPRLNLRTNQMRKRKPGCELRFSVFSANTQNRHPNRTSIILDRPVSILDEFPLKVP
jgi:hypothetical protein